MTRDEHQRDEGLVVIGQNARPEAYPNHRKLSPLLARFHPFIIGPFIIGPPINRDWDQVELYSDLIEAWKSSSKRILSSTLSTNRTLGTSISKSSKVKLVFAIPEKESSEN